MRTLSWRALLGRIRHILLGAVAVLAVTTQTAGAADYHAAIRDCNDDGVLQGHYSLHTLRQARAHLPASLQEYSDCADVLAKAIAQAGRPGSGGTAGGHTAPPLGNPALTTGSGAVAPNTQQKQALEQQASQSTKDVPPTDITVGGRNVLPGSAGLSNTAAVHASPNDLPGPLLVLLIVLAATAALATALALRHRWPETRRVALRILRR